MKRGGMRGPSAVIKPKEKSNDSDSSDTQVSSSLLNAIKKSGGIGILI
jgi:hypothetical protein